VELVLVAKPLVCLYVDMVCWDLSLRILVIGGFIRSLGTKGEYISHPMIKYERYVEGKRSAFSLEDWVLSGSTIVLSSGVFVYAAVLISKWGIRPRGSPAARVLRPVSAQRLARLRGELGGRNQLRKLSKGLNQHDTAER
jgi:hypothetical protein